MLEGLTPSIELTGGPWYTDNDLDTELIETVARLCRRYVVQLVRLRSRFQSSTDTIVFGLKSQQATRITLTNSSPSDIHLICLPRTKSLK